MVTSCCRITVTLPHPQHLWLLVKAEALVGQSSIPSQTGWYPEPLDLKRLRLLMVPVVLADPAIAFDGRWYDMKKKLKFLLISRKQKLLQSIQSLTNTAWTSK